MFFICCVLVSLLHNLKPQYLFSSSPYFALLLLYDSLFFPLYCFFLLFFLSKCALVYIFTFPYL